jgi:hypothetical protein
MPKFEVEPLGPLSWDFRVTSGGREVTTLELTRFRDRGQFVLDGATYAIGAEGFLRPVYRLERGGVTVARAEAKGILRPTYAVTTGDRVLELRPQGFLGFRYAVGHGRTALGAIRRLGVFSRRTAGELDDRIDPACRIFLIFVALVRWRHQSRRSS